MLNNTPGTRIGLGFRDQTLAVKSRKNTPKSFIPSSYAKKLGETKFQLPEYPGKGSKAMSVERKKEGERERRAKVSVNNGQ